MLRATADDWLVDVVETARTMTCMSRKRFGLNLIQYQRLICLDFEISPSGMNEQSKPFGSLVNTNLTTRLRGSNLAPYSL
jgi:hypothetical protein